MAAVTPGFRALPAALLLLCACSTTGPLQPASVLPPGDLRVIGQAALSPWCSLSGDVAGRCAELPEGTPLPEARVTVRRGLTEAVDVGASVRAHVHLPPGSGFLPSWRGSLGVDAKWLLWRQGRLLLSVAPGATFNLSSVPPRNGLEVIPGGELLLPVLAGRRFGAWELVGDLGATLLLDRTSDAERRWFATSALQLGVGFYRVAPGGLGVHLGYRAPWTRLGDGPLVLSVGWLVDFTAAPRAPPPPPAQ